MPLRNVPDIPGPVCLYKSTEPWVIYDLLRMHSGGPENLTEKEERLFSSMKLLLATLDRAVSGELRNLRGRPGG